MVRACLWLVQRRTGDGVSQSTVESLLWWSKMVFCLGNLRNLRNEELRADDWRRAQQTPAAACRMQELRVGLQRGEAKGVVLREMVGKEAIGEGFSRRSNQPWSTAARVGAWPMQKQWNPARACDPMLQADEPSRRDREARAGHSHPFRSRLLPNWGHWRAAGNQELRLGRLFRIAWGR